MHSKYIHINHTKLFWKFAAIRLVNEHSLIATNFIPSYTHMQKIQKSEVEID